MKVRVGMIDENKKQRKRLAILDRLASANGPLSCQAITVLLAESGLEISSRTVRLYLKQLQDEKLVLPQGRNGYCLTSRGQAAQGSPRLLERVGYMNSKIDEITYSMNFDLELRAGTVAVNTALVSREALVSHLPKILKVFEKRFSMGTLVAVLNAGECIGELSVPRGMLGFCTVCSVTLNGVLVKHGIPVRSLFSGLLEIIDGKAVRFSELINYDGTTLDPLELFIRGGKTDYCGAVEFGNGKIGAGFREFPAKAHDQVMNLADRAERIGLGGFLRIGYPNETLFNIPVRQGCCGAVVIGGLNPVAILEESGEHVQACAMSGMMEFHRLFPYQELPGRLHIAG